MVAEPRFEQWDIREAVCLASRNRRRQLLIWAAGGLVLLSAIVAVLLNGQSAQEEPVVPTVGDAGFHGFLLDPPHPAPELALVDQHEMPFRLAEHQGDLIVVFFGYTNCPDVCPATLIYYTQVKQQLGPLAERVRFVFVTVDPEYDTPEHLHQYISRFDPSFYGLTGTKEQVEHVLADYGVMAEKVEAETSPVGYWVNHSALSYVIDTAGNLRLALPFGVEPENIASDLRRLL